MPLKSGSSKETISQNISELEHSDTEAGKKRTHDQNIAIAMDKAGKSRDKNSDGPPHTQKPDLSPRQQRRTERGHRK